MNSRKAYFVFSLLIVCLVLSTSYAQNSRIDEINKLYSEIGKNIENDMTLHHRIELESLIPGVGIKNSEIHFYYSLKENETSEAILHPSLSKITVRYSLAAGSSYFIEFVYDNSEELIFYYSRADGYECKEARFYFDGGKPIKIKTNVLTEDCIEGGSEKDFGFEKTEEFSGEDIENAGKIAAKSSEYKSLFTRMVKIDNNPKPKLIFSISDSGNVPPVEIKFTGIYKDFPGDECRELNEKTPEGDKPKICAGIEGYQLYVTYDTYGYEIISVRSTENDFETPFIINDCTDPRMQGYSEKIEWRLANGKPFACIVNITCYELTVAEEDGLEYEIFKPYAEYVMVKGLDGYENIYYLIDTKEVPNAGERARELADEGFKNYQ